MTAPRYLNRADAAKRLRDEFGRAVTKQYLARAAVRGDGPPFMRWGRDAIYEVAALDTWALAQMGPAMRRAADHRTSDPENA